MAVVELERVVRVLGTDEVRITGTVDGQRVSARLWWSGLLGLSPAARRVAAAQALAAAVAPVEQDLGITGTVTV
jgi:hypothetical protein